MTHSHTTIDVFQDCELGVYDFLVTLQEADLHGMVVFKGSAPRTFEIAVNSPFMKRDQELVKQHAIACFQFAPRFTPEFYMYYATSPRVHQNYLHIIVKLFHDSSIHAGIPPRDSNVSDNCFIGEILLSFRQRLEVAGYLAKFETGNRPRWYTDAQQVRAAFGERFD